MRGSTFTPVTPRGAVSVLVVLLSAAGFGQLLNSVAFAGQAANSTIVAGYRFTSFDAPGAAVSGLTDPHHINNVGAIVGVYWDPSFARHGFVRSPGGVITSFTPPGSVDMDAEGINDSG